ncbi:hypothetical protein [Dickeya sp. NCPPB 3274]|uniref:hypothetical protein n=1 Tax=Dickeya sp. NCPPB 3274 TaxID=568766 RepID=UPI0005B3BE2F|nr:hypothetical protein [Dickeya sp. NCPPB 3274]
MNNHHTIIKHFKMHHSKLGDALFPEETFFEVEARHFVSELLSKHDGNIESAQQFLLLLETFTPEIVQDSIDNPSWSTEKTVSRWENMTKGMIKQRVMQFFSTEFKDIDGKIK